jgi:nondiscriminating aspartyl-tRNA synthetase
MERTYIKDLKEKTGKEVLVVGFVQVIRDQGGIKFLLLRDVTGSVQIVVLKANKDVFDFVKDLTLESVVEIEGLAKEEKQAPGGLEVQAQKITLLSLAAAEMPIPVTEKGGEETEQTKRFDWRWIDLRKPERQLIFKVWTELESGFREALLENNFIEAYPPYFMSTPSESGAEVFEVKYFDRKAYLAQSPQFYKQMAMAAGFERIFMFGPAFRAELSYTTRHTTEFTSWDFEMSYIKSHHDIMAMEEKLIVRGFEKVKQNLGIDLEVPTIPFPRITMKEAKEKLAKAGVPSERAFDINAEEEKKLYEIVKEETGHDFIFLTDWPVEGRAFYHMRYEDDPKITKGFDLLYRGLEITTGAQREHRVPMLEKQATEKGINLESLKDYVNFFRYGCPPHGGVGIGPARLIMKILDLPSVKEAVFLPRDVKRLRP